MWPLIRKSKNHSKELCGWNKVVDKEDHGHSNMFKRFHSNNVGISRWFSNNC